MAHDSHNDHYAGRGSMDLREHRRTWSGFVVGVKWSIYLTVAILIFLAIFRTN